jgi:hypothetical protein
MSRGLLLFLTVAALSLLTAFFLWDVFRRAPQEEEKTATLEPAVTSPVAKTRGAAAVAPRRSMEITGRVLGTSSKPISGLAVLCGEDRAATDSAGLFSFPPAVRPRLVRLRLLRGEAEVTRWDELLAGDLSLPASEEAEGEGNTEGQGGTAGDGSGDAAALPAKPLIVRWTLNLLVGEKGPAAPSSWIEPEEALAEEWGNGGRVRVRGKSKLPDGAHVATSLYFDGFRFIAGLEPAEVNNGAFLASMLCPPELKLFPGPYEINASFNPILESPSKQLEWKQAKPEVDWGSLIIPEVKVGAFVGNPGEARSEDLKVAAYYSRVLDEAKQLERALKSRVEEIAAFSKGWDPKLLSNWHLAREGWFQQLPIHSSGNSSGSFAEDRWRKFLDEDWRPKVKALKDRHAERRQEKYQEAGERLASLLSALYQESFVYSSFLVYPAFGLKSHASDFYPDEDEIGDLGRLENILRDNFKNLERFRRLARDEAPR